LAVVEGQEDLAAYLKAFSFWDQSAVSGINESKE